MVADIDSDPEMLSPRQREIVAIVKAQGYAPVEALARRFEVSTQTIRRDIIRLDELGILQRFHGGAGISDNAVRLGYAEKLAAAPDTKERIGRAAAALIPDGSSVFLDVGTTVEAVAKALKARRGLHVFTSSMAAALHLVGGRDIEIFVTGGLVRGADGSLVGDAAIAALQRFRLDFAVLGLSGFDRDGWVMDFDLHKVGVKQAAMAAADRVIAVADRSKFDRTAIVRVAPPEEIDLLVSDGMPPAGLRDALEAGGTRIVAA